MRIIAKTIAIPSDAAPLKTMAVAMEVPKSPPARIPMLDSMAKSMAKAKAVHARNLGSIESQVFLSLTANFLRTSLSVKSEFELWI